MSSLKSKEAKSPRGTSGAHLSSPTRVVIIASRVNTPPPEQPKVVPAWPAELGPRPGRMSLAPAPTRLMAPEGRPSPLLPGAAKRAGWAVARPSEGLPLNGESFTIRCKCRPGRRTPGATVNAPCPHTGQNVLTGQSQRTPRSRP